MPNGSRTAHERAWIAGIRQGDEDAFEAVFREYYAGLCVVVARMTGSDAIAEELVQGLFLRIWDQREEWTVSGNLTPYLYGAARNEALHYLRHERVERKWRERTVREEDTPAMGSPPAEADEAAHASELQATIQDALDALPPRTREAFLLRRQNGLSYAEIAEAMGISPKTVEVQIGAALKALRESLKEWRE